MHDAYSMSGQPSCRRLVRCLIGGTALLAASLVGTGASRAAPVTLSYALWDGSQVPAMQQIIDKFHAAHPDINVKIQLTPFTDYWTKLQTSATGGSAPDVFWMSVLFAQYYSSGGALLPLNDKIKQDGIDMSVYVPAITKAYQYDGTTYGIPKDVNAFGLFYNKDLFKAAGVAVPDNNWTWDKVVEAAQKLTNPTKGIYGIVAPEAWETSWYLTVPQAGGRVISDDHKTSGYDSPQSIKGIQFWVDLINKYHASPNLQQTTDTDPRTLFTSGKVAMYYGGSWDPAAIAEVPAAKAFTGVTRLPKGTSENYYSNGLANVIYANTPHPQEAWEFVKFLSSKEANEIQASTGTVIPAYKGQADNYVKGLSWLTGAQSLVDQLPNALPLPASKNTAVWLNYANQELAKAWTGQESVPDATATIAKQMNDALANE
jgi:multiple sugar transport system substrate-binding protein